MCTSTKIPNAKTDTGGEQTLICYDPVLKWKRNKAYKFSSRRAWRLSVRGSNSKSRVFLRFSVLILRETIRLRLINTLHMSLVIFAKCHILQPNVNRKYGMYVFPSKICPEAYWAVEGPHCQHEQGRHSPYAPVFEKLLLKKINRLYSSPAAQLPRPRRKQPVYAEFILATGWYFSNTRLILIPSEFSQAAGESKLQKWSQVSF